MKMPIFFFTLIFFFSSCYNYCTNKAPIADGFSVNNDACFKSDKVEIIDFIAGSSTPNTIKVDLIIKGPCKTYISTKANPSFSLGIYNTHDIQIPSNLLKLNFASSLPMMLMSPCGNKANIPDYSKLPADLQKLSNGLAISFDLGASNKDRLYPFAFKLPYGNGKASASGKYCMGGGDKVFSPFIMDQTTLSSVEQGGHYVTNPGLPEAGTQSVYEGLIGMAAPYYTYGPIHHKGSQMGIKSSHNDPRGSHYSFNVKIKPGSYYLVFGTILEPMKAMASDFSWGEAKVLTSVGMKDYIKDCHTDIQHCGVKTLKIVVH